MQNKPARAEQEATTDSKREPKKQLQDQDGSKSIWDSVFNCKFNESEKSCKKIKFKWVC